MYNCALKTPKETVYAVAVHPTADNAKDLLLLKNNDLKTRLRELGISEEGVDLRSNPSIRRTIWASFSDPGLARQEIPLDKEDAKKAWESIRTHLPVYALFQADRSSKDEDAEVQDPMKVAVKEAIKDVETELDEIKRMVREKATEVARRTVEKLREMDPNLARDMSPNFRVEPKWEQLFKLSLTGDDQIPINKRGSGIRRLILISFFRASAEKKEESAPVPGIIYAIEEPETSQHPINQKLIIEALIELSERENRQILITTHVPGLAGMLPTDAIRYVRKKEDETSEVVPAGDDIFELAASELGVIPDNRIEVLGFVEGPNDISCITHLSSLLHQHDGDIPDLTSDARVTLVPVGGSSLHQWVTKRYLKGFGRPEIHIYDRGTEDPPRYQGKVEEINAQDGCYAVLTGKRELENYLHPDAIQEVFGVEVTFEENDSVPEIVARTVHENSDSPTSWDELPGNTRENKISERKRRLNDEVAGKMTIEQLRASDPNEDIANWLREIAARLR